MNIEKQSIKSFVTKQSDYFKIPEFTSVYLQLLSVCDIL